jgi:diguanylate cyclase (GGDEF)-like protein
MLNDVSPPSPALDLPTLLFVAVVIVAVLGLLLAMTWVQQRSMRALAWWGSAYMIGASSMAMWSAPAPMFKLPSALPAALIFVACGMIWNGVRLFHGRRLLPVPAFAGAVAWLLLCQLPALGEGSNGRLALGVIVVAAYTFFIAFELWRERRKSLHSRTAAAIVPTLNAAIFLMPLAMRAFFPNMFGADWMIVFTLEAMIYMVGTAFIVLLMVKDYDVSVYRNAAGTDPLTGLFNRRAFLEGSLSLCARQAKRGQPVTVLMFDLDHFKSVNDSFGHGTGDDVLRVFAKVASSSLRANDILGRLGGEEFAVILAEPMPIGRLIAERIRAAFEKAGAKIADLAINATVSVGAATSQDPVTNIDALLARADEALYRAKRHGRNRLYCAADEPPSEPPVGVNAAPAAETAAPRGFARRRLGRAKGPDQAATSRLLYPR